MHHWQYIGERKLLMNENTGQCPMQCGQLETKLHYLYCTDLKITMARKNHIILLVKQMKALNSYPGIMFTFTQILKNGYEWDWACDIKNHNLTD